METPNKMIGGIAGAMAQQAGALAASPPQQMTSVPPPPSNVLGGVQPVFNSQAQQNAQGMFGGMDQRQKSVGATCMFKDQTGDGKITQADVIKARTKGYKK